MQWLQATFANRFNRFRGEHGHLFQGRYKALLVEPGAALGEVCHYIHLNPVRAGIVPVAHLTAYRYSSYWYLDSPPQRPPFLRFDTALAAAGELADTAAGRRCYADYLAWQSAEGPCGRTRAYVQFSRGWVIGTPEFRQALLHEQPLTAEARAWERCGAREIRAHRWSAALRRCLRHLGKSSADVRRDPKSAEWKALVALCLKERTQAGNRWLAEQLHMGRPEAVSTYVRRLRSSGLVSRRTDYRQLIAIVST